MFRCTPVFKRHLVKYKAFALTPVNESTKYTVFLFAKISNFLHSRSYPASLCLFFLHGFFIFCLRHLLVDCEIATGL